MKQDRGKGSGFAVCVDAGGYAGALEERKIYPVRDDSAAESEGLVRVVDESGDDYLYPARMFERVKLPVELQRALRLAS